MAVQSFSNFTKDNDPHGEHDFGSIEIEGEIKDSNGQPVVTRVLTIMLAEEY